jgi:hypothetical protein
MLPTVFSGVKLLELAAVTSAFAWLSVGNAGTGVIQRLLTESQEAIRAFVADPETAFMVVSLKEA